MIKLCPHCNGTAALCRTDIIGTAGEPESALQVCCDVCGASGKPYLLEGAWNKSWEELEETAAAQDAIAAWNLRAVPQDIAVLITETVVKALQKPVGRGRKPKAENVAAAAQEAPQGQEGA